MQLDTATADANWFTYAHSAAMDDVRHLSRRGLRGHAQAALWYLIQDNRAIRRR